jgi:hypothetical protein
MAEKIDPFIMEIRNARKNAGRCVADFHGADLQKIARLTAYICILEDALESNIGYLNRKRFSWWLSDRMRAFFPRDYMTLASSEYWLQILKSEP